MMLAEITSPGDALMAVAVTVLAAGVFVQVIRSRERKERLRVIEKALQSGNLDEATQRTLVDSLTGRAQAIRPQWLTGLYQGVVYLCRHSIFVAGWIGMFVGIAVMLSGEPYMFAGGVITALVSFGVVTVPLALRELETRKGT